MLKPQVYLYGMAVLADFAKTSLISKATVAHATMVSMVTPYKYKFGDDVIITWFIKEIKHASACYVEI